MSKTAFFGSGVIISLLVLYLVCPASALTPRQIYRQAADGVVFVFAAGGHSDQGNGGTGIIVTRNGLVLTNAHLFFKGERATPLDRITVYLKPKHLTGTVSKDLTNGYRAKMVAMDRRLDMAMIRMVRPPSHLRVIEFADPDQAGVGSAVYAIGHPEQGGLWSLTTGVISARWNDYGGIAGKDVFQTDAGINRGNSGGPLLDENGRLVGINTMIIRKADDGLTITDINFAIQSRVALIWARQNGIALEAKAAKQIAAGQSADRTVDVNDDKVEISHPAPVDQPLKKKKSDTAPPSPSTKNRAGDQAMEEKSPPPAGPEGKTGQSPLKKQPRILTEKKPYRMESLLKEMREMEDFMDDMRQMMKEFKKDQHRRKNP